MAYAANLSRQAAIEARQADDPARRTELENLARICRQVVAHPARTLDEAVNAVWITWVGLHMESTNAGLSLGRLDQWLQPYFEADMAGRDRPEDRQAYLRHAIELIGCFMLRCTDHLPLTPDFANYYFGGSSSDQAITLGRVTPQGEDAVNDMTYIFLKVTEMLSLRDPNVNARCHLAHNSDAYLKRLCDVNLTTAATPSLHNDEAIWQSLAEFDYAPEDLRNWSATGCVEPTLWPAFGRHQFPDDQSGGPWNGDEQRAPPLMDWRLGPDTGRVEKGDFVTLISSSKLSPGRWPFSSSNPSSTMKCWPGPTR